MKEDNVSVAVRPVNEMRTGKEWEEFERWIKSKGGKCIGTGTGKNMIVWFEPVKEKEG